MSAPGVLIDPGPCRARAGPAAAEAPEGRPEAPDPRPEAPAETPPRCSSPSPAAATRSARCSAGDPGNSLLIMGDFGLSAAALAASASCFLYARAHDRRMRPAWLLFAFSSAMAAAGNAVWGWYEVVQDRPVPSPSLADVFFLLFAPPAIVGLLVLAKRPVTRAGWICLALDSWLIAGSLLTLSWSLALAHTATFRGERRGRRALPGLPAARHRARQHGPRPALPALKGNRSAVHTAIAALALTVLCDALFTSPLLRDTYRSGQLLDAGWFAGSLLLAYAPWGVRRAADLPPRPGALRARPATPAAPSPDRSPPSPRTWRPRSAPSASCTASSRAAEWTASSSSRAAPWSSPWSSGRASCCWTTSPSPTNWPRRRTTSGRWCRVRATSS